ncbi:hypothetical protein AYO47_00065 [Planctomyces sp. SCGC AG-212-M04]|nr:hypothetical protein AYO47_00065 [Planctomyces sp. SCGC AG-212-M04]
MSIRPLRTRDRLAIIGLGLLCLPLLFELGPFIEESRGEARAIQAYNLARQLQTQADRVRADAPDKLEELDPWGNPFQVRHAGDGAVRVVSGGPNGQSPVEGIDADDIYADMTDPPAVRIHRQKRMQWWIALGETGGVFLLAVAIYLWSRRIPE